MTFLPLYPSLEENQIYLTEGIDEEMLQMSVDFFQKVGYHPPWIGYYVELGDQLVGSCAYKGKPQNGKVEIAYGVNPAFQNQGIASAMCKQLVELALATDPTVLVTARTLPEINYSNRLLKKNGFQFQGIVDDPEDGEVWEWLYVAE
jgi:RimJ/RimL family protein N-acetyltransferase